MMCLLSCSVCNTKHVAVFTHIVNLRVPQERVPQKTCHRIVETTNEMHVFCHVTHTGSKEVNLG